MSTTFINPPPPTTTIPELHQTHAHLIKTSLIHHPFTASHLIFAAVSLKTHTYPHTMTSLTLFKDMLVDDNVVYGYVVKTGADGDLYICNTLIHFYAKNREFEYTRKVLDEICVKDVVSWNAGLSVYCETGMMEDARDGERGEDMWKDGVVHDDYTFVNVLSCCASASGLSQGEWIHAYVDKNRIEVGGSLFWVLAEFTMTLKWQSVDDGQWAVSIDPGCCMIEFNGEFLAGEGMVW
ncbi:pentatricopeptide repeat-containing protein [Tanacetum coccineum]